MRLAVYDTRQGEAKGSRAIGELGAWHRKAEALLREYQLPLTLVHHNTFHQARGPSSP
jgi:hypothetical protein